MQFDGVVYHVLEKVELVVAVLVIIYEELQALHLDQPGHVD